MPREFVLLAPAPVSMTAIAAAALTTDQRPALEVSDDRMLATLVDAGTPLLTIVHPREIGVPSEIARLLPPLLAGTPEPRWWVDVLVPWGASEERGIALALALAATLGGALYDPLLGTITER